MLTIEQLNLIEGSLLGDGFFSRLKKYPTWNWKFGKRQSTLDIQKNDKISYLEYHKKIMSNLSSGIYASSNKEIKIGNNKNITPRTYSYTFNTKTHPQFTSIGKKWYKILFNKF